MEDNKEPGKEEAKQEEKKVDAEIPVVGVPKNEYVIPKIKEKKILANIYSYLPINSLVEALKVNRHSFKLFTDTNLFNKDIMKWEYSKAESKAIYDFYKKVGSSDYDESLRYLMFPEFYQKDNKAK
jgi:hypothetical protein